MTSQCHDVSALITSSETATGRSDDAIRRDVTATRRYALAGERSASIGSLIKPAMALKAAANMTSLD